MNKTTVYEGDSIIVTVLPDGVIKVQNDHKELMSLTELQARELREVINEIYPEEIIQVKV